MIPGVNLTSSPEERRGDVRSNLTNTINFIVAAQVQQGMECSPRFSSVIYK